MTILLIAVAVLIADPASPTATTTTTTSGAVVDPTLGPPADPSLTTTTGAVVIPTTGPAADPFAAFERATVKISGEVWLVAIASEPHQWIQGLMFVTDLGDLDGMLFVWEEDTTGPFWMKDTLLPLDIAFFDADGTLVDLLSMEPCTTDPCPVYEAAGPYRYALEAPRGAFDAIDQPFLLVENP